jgi:hypothetical protein
MMKRNWLFILLAVAVLCVPQLARADVRAAIPEEPVVVEGTIQGLQHACMGVYCKPGEENLVAALEDDYVLMGEDQYYFLPNLKPTLLARYINMLVRITGKSTLRGEAILVQKAEVLENGKWKPFYNEEIATEMDRRRLAP